MLHPVHHSLGFYWVHSRVSWSEVRGSYTFFFPRAEGDLRTKGDCCNAGLLTVKEAEVHLHSPLVLWNESLGMKQCRIWSRVWIHAVHLIWFLSNLKSIFKDFLRWHCIDLFGMHEECDTGARSMGCPETVKCDDAAIFSRCVVLCLWLSWVWYQWSVWWCSKFPFHPRAWTLVSRICVNLVGKELP